jgi:hypothetical protein
MASHAEPGGAEAATPSLQQRLDAKWGEIRTKVKDLESSQKEENKKGLRSLFKKKGDGLPHREPDGSVDKFDIASVPTALGKYLDNAKEKGVGETVRTFLEVVKNVGEAVVGAVSLVCITP